MRSIALEELFFYKPSSLEIEQAQHNAQFCEECMEMQPHYVIHNRIICYLCNKGYFLREPVKVLRLVNIVENVIPLVKSQIINEQIKRTYFI